MSTTAMHTSEDTRQDRSPPWVDYQRPVSRVAILGAGVMGAQIAAHFANAGIPALLFELSAEATDRNAHARKAVAALAKQKPPPLAWPGASRLIRVANYEDDLQRLRDCDLVIEAIVERADLKQDLYRRVAPHLREDAILATNTSGIAVQALAGALPEGLRSRFCGMHFFNPPRYMHLLELVPHEAVSGGALDLLEGFCTTVLGKGVIRARDTPGFVGNRVGVFSMLAVMRNAEHFGLPLDLVDKLTGHGIGRPKSATFRTADVVGLDVFAHVVENLAGAVQDDPWREGYRVPAWVDALIEKGALGQKTGAGIYRKQGREIQVLDLELQDYRRVRPALDDEVRDILKIAEPAAKYDALAACDHPQARFLRAVFLDLFHFCAWHLEHIANSARDVDLAMRWGYGWKLGPFEAWQAAGWARVSRDIASRVEAGDAMSDVPLPDWALDPGRTGVHGPGGSWSASARAVVPRPDHPVYRRQRIPERLLGEPQPRFETVMDNEAVRLWHAGEDIVVLEFLTKMHTVSEAVLDGVIEAVRTAEDRYRALVLWQPEPPFSAGANLGEFAGAVRAGDLDVVERVVEKFQRASLALRHSRIPTVAAVNGLALGGGCEFAMHCDRVVAALESYIGLVEVGVGFIPAGGGCKVLAMRAEAQAMGGDLFPFIARYFEKVAMASVSGSALEARVWGYLQPDDAVVFHGRELLHVAIWQARALFEAGYRPPVPREDVRVAGAAAIATLKAQMVNMMKGGFISEHDYEVGSRLATALCGGAVEPGSRVSEAWLLKLERKAFMELAATEKTLARVEHMLRTGKPLRN